MPVNNWAFFFYCLSVVIVGIPLILSAMLIGRQTRLNSINCIYTLARDSDASKASAIAWALFSAITVLLTVLVLVLIATKLHSIDFSNHTFDYLTLIGTHSAANRPY